jgi:hypothetical protein
MYVPECIERSAIVNNFQIESRLWLDLPCICCHEFWKMQNF